MGAAKKTGNDTDLRVFNFWVNCFYEKQERGANMWYIVTIVALAILNLFQLVTIIKCVKRMQVLQNQIILLEKAMGWGTNNGAIAAGTSCPGFYRKVKSKS